MPSGTIITTKTSIDAPKIVLRLNGVSEPQPLI